MKKYLVLLLALILSGNILAQENLQKARKNQFALGFGGLIQRKPYKGYDTKGYPLPYIYYESDSFFFRQLTAGYHIYSKRNISLDFILKGRLDGYDDDDSHIFEGMDDRDHTIDAGIKLSVYDGWGMATLYVVGDTLSKHEGYEAELTYAKRFTDGKLTLIPSLGLAYESQNLVDYYYGVRDDEIRAGRPAYEAGNEVSFLASLGLRYQLDEKWDIYSFTSYRWLGSEITKSPLVGRDYEISVGAGLAYEF